MKIKAFWIALPAIGLIVAAVLAGKALVAKAVSVLPPTGAPVRVPQLLETHHWLNTGFRWGIYTETAEQLEEPEDSPFDKLRVTGAPGTLPTPGSTPGPSLPTSPSVRGELVEPRTEQEPTIRQAQMAAIRYAEVMPEKIRRWRFLSQTRNFVPRFTLGLDRDSNTTVASSTSAGKTTFAVGPADETTSVDYGFTWDLGNLIWDSAQTSIDARSRLMVQLRQDILEETTRIYFERERLRAEFEAGPTDDPALQRERSLRLQELTAQLDAITGGLYSDQESAR